jgi:4-hydroxythreonine-4-phosphate dehydrogenase
MKNKPILILAGEPNSIFSEILAKSIKIYKSKSPIILIISKALLQAQFKKLKIKLKINLINFNDIAQKNLKTDAINLIDIYYNQKKPFNTISSKSKLYIEKCFDLAIDITNKKLTDKFINGPVSKKFFLDKKFNGITEYLAYKTNTKKFGMVIYNKILSVCPITTHLPVKNISKQLSKNEIIDKTKLINDFWKKKFGFKPKIAMTGLNPHCETTDIYSEDEKIIKPTIKLLKKFKINISGPYPADTIFLKNNRKNFDIIVGMYHDQVLGPMKTIFEYNAINVTVGLPFVRVSPDHGPNEQMIGKNKSNPISLLESIKFLDY